VHAARPSIDFGSSRSWLHAAPAGGGFTTPDYRIPHAGRDGARGAFLKTSATAAGWKRGRGPSTFFLEPHTFRSAPQPAIRLSPATAARSRESSPRTTAAGTRRPSRAPNLCKIAHQVFVEAGSGALPAGIISGGLWGWAWGALKRRFIVDLVARSASAVAGSPRATPCPAHRSSRGARSFPEAVGNGRRMKARQGPSGFFFGNPIVFHSAPQAAIRLHLMRDLVNRPTSRPQWERAGHPILLKIAHQVFMEAGSRALATGILPGG
jgi:hypothetical protein